MGERIKPVVSFFEDLKGARKRLAGRIQQLFAKSAGMRGVVENETR
jgi:hypothetical protein